MVKQGTSLHLSTSDTNNGTSDTNSGIPQLPFWAQSLIEKYQAPIAHAFLLHGSAIWDYPAGTPGEELRNFLMSDLTRKLGFRQSLDIILYWDRRGFAFLTPDMKQRFGVAAGLGGKSADRSNSPAALIQAATGQTMEVTMEGKLEQQGATPTTAFKLIDKVLRLDENAARELFPPQNKKAEETWRPFRVAVVIGYGEAQAPAANEKPSESDRTNYVILSEWARNYKLGDRGHILLMCVDDVQEMDPRLRRSSARWEQVQIPYPNVEQRAAFIREIIRESEEEAHKDDDAVPIRLADGFTDRDFARATAGLPYAGLHDIALRARLRGVPIDRALVAERRAEIIASEYSDVLVLGESTMTFDDLGGMDIQKRFLREEVIVPLRAGDRRRVPQGILFLGPAGVGKSEVARVLANESGVLFVEVQVSQLLNLFVGNSEKNLERVLTGITVFAPAIVWLDEIEKFLRKGSQRDGDSGVGARMKKRLMEFMADRKWKGLIVWVAATNEPYDLDAALIRPGRFDIKLPFVVPDTAGIAEILEKRVRMAFADMPKSRLPESDVYSSLAEHMNGYQTGMYYTGAEITSLVDKAYALYYKQVGALTVSEALEEAYKRTLPTTQEIERMQEDALALTNDLDLIPPHLWEHVRALRMQKKVEVPPVSYEDNTEVTVVRGTRSRRGK